MATVSEKRSIFFDEWQACLRAHYKFVIQDNDIVTEPTLRGVLLQTGLSEDELHALADEALAEVSPEFDPEVEPAATPEADDQPDDQSSSGQMALF